MTQASPASNSEGAENVPTPSCLDESTESNITPDSKSFQFSETHEKYMAYHKSIKCPRIVNSELLDRVDRVSRSIEGASSLLNLLLTQPRYSRTLKIPTHDVIRWVTYFLGSIELIPHSSTTSAWRMILSSTRTPRNRVRWESPMGNPRRQTPILNRWDRLSLWDPRGSPVKTCSQVDS